MQTILQVDEEYRLDDADFDHYLVVKVDDKEFKRCQRKPWILK
jgi:hypothetical protein